MVDRGFQYSGAAPLGARQNLGVDHRAARAHLEAVEDRPTIHFEAAIDVLDTDVQDSADKATPTSGVHTPHQRIGTAHASSGHDITVSGERDEAGNLPEVVLQIRREQDDDLLRALVDPGPHGWPAPLVALVQTTRSIGVLSLRRAQTADVPSRLPSSTTSNSWSRSMFRSTRSTPVTVSSMLAASL